MSMPKNNQQALDSNDEYDLQSQENRNSNQNENQNSFTFDQFDYEEIEDDLYQEIKELVYLIMDKSISDGKKDELTISLFNFFYQQVTEFADQLQMNVSLNMSPQTNNFLSNMPNPFFNYYGPNFYQLLPPLTVNNIQNPPFLQPPMSPMQSYNLPYQFPYPQSLPLIQPNYLYSTNIAASNRSNPHKSHKHAKNSKDHKDHKKGKKKTEKTSKKHKKHHKSDADNYDIETFTFNASNPFNGIFNYLNGKIAGNIHDKLVVQITTNSLMSSSYHPKNLVDFYSSADYIAKSNHFYAWVMFDFLNREVKILSYTIKSSNCKIGHLKSWVIEISKDGVMWETIDERIDDESLNGENIVKNFEVQKKKEKFTKFCRFRHTGEYWGFEPDCTSIEFNAIEFYGKIRTPKNQ